LTWSNPCVGIESAARLRAPVTVAYNEAIWIAVLGLLVNLASAWLLGSDHGHDHGHGHAHHGHSHDDNNLRSAYVHVLADERSRHRDVGPEALDELTSQIIKDLTTALEQMAELAAPQPAT
jgi:hypothetical protein